VDNCIHLAPAVISIQEHRSADGLDRHVPVILSDGVLYDADLDRFFLDLPLNGVRSPHSTQAPLGVSGDFFRQRLQMDRRVVEPNVTIIFRAAVGSALKVR